MNKRKARTIWNKGGSGSDTIKLTLPTSWIRDMEITKDQREVEIEYDETTKTIRIKKNCSLILESEVR